MAIPDYASIMLPLLEFAGDNKPHPINEATDALAKIFKLTKEETDALLPSGKQEIFRNRVGWARTYLKKSGLIDYSERGIFCITPRGLSVLNNKPEKIDSKFLTRFKEFQDFIAVHKEGTKKEPTMSEKTTPKEQIEYAYEQLVEALEAEVLQELKSASPKRFEHIVIDLLVAMGYGSNRQDAAKAIGGSGDEGVDGVINEDKLGVSKIYVQAKKWADNVNQKEIRNFIGSIDIKHADKGVFITTADFRPDAAEAAEKSSKKIVIVNGVQMAKLMVEYNIGVSKEDVFEIKRLDTDFFVE
jgi:restriction system protein